MHYLTLTFIDKHFEELFMQEQFVVQRMVIKRILLLIILVFAGSSISILILGNYIVGCLLIASIFILIALYRFCVQKIVYIDIMVLILQLILYSLYPLAVHTNQSIGSIVIQNDPLNQYMQGTLIAYLSFTAQLGSKYYLKAIPYLYSVTIQFVLMKLEGISFTFPFKVIFIVSAITAIIHIYYQELGRRRNFINVQSKNLSNLNVLSTFRSPYFSCYLQSYSLKIFHANQKAIRKFNLIDQAQFRIFLRQICLEFKEHQPFMNLENFIFLLIEQPDKAAKLVPHQEVMQLIGTCNKQRFKYFISKYLDEDKKEIVMVSMQKLKDFTPKPIEKLHHFVMENLYNTVDLHLEPLFRQTCRQIVAAGSLQSLLLDTYNCLLYSNIKVQDELTTINLITVITTIFKRQAHILKLRKFTVQLNIPQDCKIIRSGKKQIHILLGNLIRYCIENSNNHKNNICISFESTTPNVLYCKFYFGIQQEAQIDKDLGLQVSGFIVGQMGPLAHINFKQEEGVGIITFYIYQNQLLDQVAIVRKLSENNFVKQSIQ